MFWCKHPKHLILYPFICSSTVNSYFKCQIIIFQLLCYLFLCEPKKLYLFCFVIFPWRNVISLISTLIYLGSPPLSFMFRPNVCSTFYLYLFVTQSKIRINILLVFDCYQVLQRDKQQSFAHNQRFRVQTLGVKKFGREYFFLISLTQLESELIRVSIQIPDSI